MAISYISNALGGTTDTTSFSITLPTTQADDIIILEYTHRGTTDATLGGTSISTGGLFWTEKRDQQYATSTFSGKTLWTRATGNHSGQTITGSSLTNSCAAIVTVYRGAVTTGDPLADATVVGEQNASANETQAQITTTTNGAYVVLVVANSPDVAVTSQAATSPAALTARAERLSTGGTDTSIAHASAEKATAGATGSFTWAQTDGASGSWAYAIRPAPIALSQTAYRYYEDGTESGSTAIDAQNTNITRTVNSDSNLQLRVRIQNGEAVSDTSSNDFQLQYELNDSGTHTNIGTNTYYFNASDGGPTDAGAAYTNDSNAFDANVATAATTSTNAAVLSAIGTTSPTSGGTINQVRARMHGQTTSDSASRWGDYVTLSAPSGGWTWQKVNDLEASVQFFQGDGSLSVAGFITTINYSGSSLGTPSYNGNTAAVGQTGSLYQVEVEVSTSDAPVQGYNSASLTDGNATTNRLGAGTGSFVAGEISEDGLVDDHQITASNYTEYLYSLTLVSAALANNDTLDFRVLRNGATTGLTYTVTPRITASKTGGGAISVSDSATITESVQRQLNSFISKSDTATTSESTKVELNSNVATSDSPTLAESSRAELNSFVNKSDSSTITESVTLLIPDLYVTASDSATITESLARELNSFIATSDSSTITENRQLDISNNLAVSDSVTITESTKTELNSFVSKSDSATVTENVSLLIPVLLLSATDNATVSEAVTMLMTSFIAVTDSATITEAIALALSVQASVSDSTTISESRKTELNSFVNKSESSTITESSNVAIETIADLSVSTSDSVTITEAIGRLLTSFVTRSDSSTVSESVQLDVTRGLTVSDSATVSESTKTELNSFIAKSENATITENTSVLVPTLLVATSDSVGITEALALLLTAFIAVSDSTNITENNSQSVSVATSVTDPATVSENTALTMVSHVNVADSVTITESVSASIVAAGDRSVSVADNITVTEASNLLIPVLHLAVSDSTTISEATTVSVTGGGGGGTSGQIKFKVGGVYVAKPIKVKVNGSYATARTKYKQNGTFVETPY